MLFYNSLTRKKDPIETKGKKIRMFVCGPTVYDYPHIGHARTEIAFDVIAKWLRRRGADVHYLENITDIDDKIIIRAREEKKDPLRLAQEFENIYHEDMRALGINSVDTYARATDHIPQIISQVKTLLEKEYAYRIENDGYYFDIARFSDYGKLSGRTAAQAEDAVSRIDESIQKRNKGDFCLWKFPRSRIDTPPSPPLGKGEHGGIIIDGEPAWYDEELGWGRPGWHIEDTAITEHYFGPQYDIHGGGIDLKFPHHEAEIAQQEAASGKKPFVRIWLHTGHLLVSGEKMSKSKGNFITIRDFLHQHRADTLRLLVLQHHYRSPVDYTEEAAQQAASSHATIREFINRMTALLPLLPDKKSSTVIQQHIQKCEFDFSEAMDDDGNTPAALAALFSFIGAVESDIHMLTAQGAQHALDAAQSILSVLGITATADRIPQDILDLLEKRQALRNNKEWGAADAARTAIEEKGYKTEDTPWGSIALQKNEHQ